MRIGIATNGVVQVLATAIQGLNAAGQVFTGEAQWIAATLVGALQLVVAVLAHYSNPDATPATASYQPHK
jgi:L-arabinose isomerase